MYAIRSYYVYFLYEARLTRYPPDLRERRQRTKNIVIPLFMAIMTYIFASFYFSMSAHTVREETILSLLPVAVVYFACVAGLVLTWASSSSMLFRLVDERLDATVSAEKDLTQRLVITSYSIHYTKLYDFTYSTLTAHNLNSMVIT